MTYVAEPTAARFHASDAFVRGIRGPIGSGKSVACCAEILARAMRQTPNKGVRKSRWAVIRNTYPELRSTTIRTWSEWIPPEVSSIVYSAPIATHITQRLPDGTHMDLEVLFLALDRPRDIKKLKSLDLTGVWINEASEISKAVVDMATGRVGRFPGKGGGQGKYWSGIILDTNSPDDDHWWYRAAEEERPDDWEFFAQPPAVLRVGDAYMPNPAAENIKNHVLGHDYYMRQVEGKSHEWISVFLMGQYGTVQEGRRVYPEYTDHRHCADVTVAKGLPIILGWDFGRTPACAVLQVSSRGQLRVLREFTALDMGIRQFARDIVRPALLSDYAGMHVRSYADPAGAARSQIDEKTCIQILAEEGIPTEPANTQDPERRRDAVAQYMLRTDGEGAPGFVVSPTCKMLRKGFNGGYKYARVQVAGDERYQDRPYKNIYSHIHDALQYGALATHVRAETRQVARQQVVSSAAGWS